MPRTNRPPAYRHHKARNLAVVTIDGKNHYLGPFDSPESHERYGQLIAEWKRHGRQLLPTPASTADAQPPLTVGELLLLYFRFAETYYRKHDRPTSELDNIRQALRFVRRLYESSSVLEFGPKALKNVRQAMADAGRCRNLINKDVHRIRGMFRWAVEEELIPIDVHRQLTTVTGLRKGRSSARETCPVLPVAEEHIAAVVPHLSPVVAAMVRLQHLTSARPEEVINLKPCEVVREGDVWFYHPRGHKMEHRNRDKVVVLGPKAQQVLRPWLERDPETYCFVPSEASAWRYRRKDGQAVPAHPIPPTTARRRPGKKYTGYSYRNAVLRACERAGIPVWSPRQLRHTGATLIRREYGLEAAKAVLGHTETRITEIYAERDLDLAAKIMREIG